MRDMLQFYIDGEWVDPETPNSFPVINPATEEVCGHISLGSAADVDLAVAAAAKAFETYSRTTREERIELLDAILAEFAKRHDEVAEAIMEEMGAPWGLAKGPQAGSGPQHFKAARKALETFEFEERLGTYEYAPMIPDDLAEDLSDTRKTIERHERNLEKYKNDQQQIISRFDGDIVRFKMLKGIE